MLAALKSSSLGTSNLMERIRSLKFFIFVNRCTNSIMFLCINDFFISRAELVNTSKRTAPSIAMILATITSLLFNPLVFERE